jgi:hypothetical protein
MELVITPRAPGLHKNRFETDTALGNINLADEHMLRCSLYGDNTPCLHRICFENREMDRTIYDD